MRVRKEKNQILEKALKTETSVALFAIFILTLIYVGLSMLIYYGIYKKGGSYSGACFAFGFMSLIMYLVVYGLLKGKFSETKDDDPYIKIKKGKTNYFIQRLLNNAQVQNNSNYYSNKDLCNSFLGQLLSPLIGLSAFIVGFCITFLYLMYNSESFVMIFLSLLIIGAVTGGAINNWKEYLTIKSIMNKKNVCILRKDVGYYYVHQDWIYFY